MASSITYESIQAKNIMNRVTAPSMPFEWSINPYRGCQHGCSFCYARATHTFLGVEADDQFQKHIFLKDNAAESLERQLARMIRTHTKIGRIAIGTATDPYQQLEAKAQLTRQCLEILAEYDLPVGITTRSPLILRDIPILQRFSDISVNLSISTLDTVIWRQFEPNSPSPVKRIETLSKLREAGITAGVFLAPILPRITDDWSSLEQLIHQAAEHGANFIEPSFLRLSTDEVKVWFFQTLRQHYPELVEWYGEAYHRASKAPDTYRRPLLNRLLRAIHDLQLESAEPVRSRSERIDDTDLPKVPIPVQSSPEQLSFDF